MVNNTLLAPITNAGIVRGGGAGCAPNIWAIGKENEVAHPIFGPYFILAHQILDCFHRHCRELQNRELQGLPVSTWVVAGTFQLH